MLLQLPALMLYSQNLVVNPGFETWSILSKPAGWTHAENCRKDSLTIFAGSYSCSHSGGVSSSSDLGQTIQIAAGMDYVLNFRYRTCPGTTGNGARIWCYWKDQSGSNVTDPATDDIMRPSKYLKSDDWSQFSVTLAAPANAAALYLEVRTYPGSGTWWDDFSLTLRTTSSIEDGLVAGFRVFPVPAGNTLNFESGIPVTKVELADITGRILMTSRHEQAYSGSLNLSAIPPGLYLLRFDAGGTKYFRKIIRRAD